MLKYFSISVNIFLYFHLKDMFVWGAPVCVWEGFNGTVGL